MRPFAIFAVAAVAYAAHELPVSGAATAPAVAAAPTYTTPPISTVEIPVFVTTTIVRSTSSSSISVSTSAPSSFTTTTISVYSNPARVPSASEHSSATSAPVLSSAAPASIYSSAPVVHSQSAAPYPVSGTVARVLPSGTGAPVSSSTPAPFVPGNAAGALQISFGGLATVAGLVAYFL